jgi:hypothetical protein
MSGLSRLGRRPVPFPVRFWSKVAVAGPDDCWEWQGAIGSTGYGNLDIDGSTVKAHRVSHLLTHGPIPPGLYVLHSCDNRRCVNPNHLRIGTAQDNADDRRIRGRGRKLTAA